MDDTPKTNVWARKVAWIDGHLIWDFKEFDVPISDVKNVDEAVRVLEEDTGEFLYILKENYIELSRRMRVGTGRNEF